MPAEPAPPRNADFHADFSHGDSARFAPEQSGEPVLSPVEHHCQLCPTCSHRLTGHRCKLICAHCGYYMSCADYY